MTKVQVTWAKALQLDFYIQLLITLLVERQISIFILPLAEG